MSRGLGATQRRILELLREHRGGFFTTHQLSRRLGVSQRQVQLSAHSLAERGLVELTLEPNLRIWPPGATKARRQYWASVDAPYAEQPLKRPAHCGPGCRENHVGCDKQHYD